MSDTEISATLALVLDDLQSRIDQYDAQRAANEAAAPELEAQGMPLGLVQQDPGTLLFGVSTLILSARDLLNQVPDEQAEERLASLVAALIERTAPQA